MLWVGELDYTVGCVGISGGLGMGVTVVSGVVKRVFDS